MNPLLSYCCLLALQGANAANGTGPPAAAQSASQPATAPASQPASAAEIFRWVNELGHSDYNVREAAQQQLAGCGERALPVLLERLDDPDPEIARRVLELLPMPIEPQRRVDLAVRLIANGRREPLRRAVEMLFADPDAITPAFNRAALAQTGRTAVMCAVIVDQLNGLVHQSQVFRRQIEQKRREDPAVAEKLEANYRRNRPDLIAHQAEAAYWLALDARDEHASNRAPESLRPVDR